jgi:uncharacterized protein (TIGR02058 family)
MMDAQKNYKRFIIEFGMGLDQHGQDPTRAAVKSVKNAIANSCLAGLIEIARLSDVNDMRTEIHIACPHPEMVNREKVLEAVPFGEKTLFITDGGMSTHGLFQPELGDTTDEAFVANAAIIVYVDVNHMLKTWQAEING